MISVPLLAGVLLLACDSGYDNTDLELMVHYRAKSVCSCLWVMERDLDHCLAWTRASPNVAGVDVDYEQQVVTAHALYLWSAQAHFTSDEHGCVLSD